MLLLLLLVLPCFLQGTTASLARLLRPEEAAARLPVVWPGGSEHLLRKEWVRARIRGRRGADVEAHDEAPSVG